MRASIAILLAATGFTMLPASALAHDARAGWPYPLYCCTGMDCSEIPASSVRETSSGYSIALTPADHQMLVARSEYLLAYDDSRLKVAPDGLYHACITRQKMIGNYAVGGVLICLFTPPKGF